MKSETICQKCGDQTEGQVYCEKCFIEKREEWRMELRKLEKSAQVQREDLAVAVIQVHRRLLGELRKLMLAKEWALLDLSPEQTHDLLSSFDMIYVNLAIPLWEIALFNDNKSKCPRNRTEHDVRECAGCKYEWECFRRELK